MFKHAAESFYSKTNVGAGGAAQQTAIMRSPTSHFRWEQKTVTKIIKKLSVNAFVGWKMFQREDLLESGEIFRSIENYCNNFNKVQPTADFVFDVARGLMWYTSACKRNLQTKKPEKNLKTSDE